MDYSAFPQVQMIEVEGHQLPLNLTPLDQLRRPLKVFFPFSRGLVRLQGPDRLSFLQGLCLVDVPKLPPGQGSRCLFANKQGKLIFDAWIWQGQNELLLFTDPGEETRLLRHLEFFCITEAVTLDLAPPWETLVLFDEAGRPDLGQGHRIWEQTQQESHLVAWAQEPGGNLAGKAGQEGYQAIGFELFEELRPGFNLARAGVDFDDQRLPQEAGLEAWMSMSKGCYLGQEPISRVAFRGHLQHKLVMLKAPNPVASGQPILCLGNEVGLVTSGSGIQVRGAFQALAYVDTACIKQPPGPLYTATSEVLLG